MKRLLFSLTIFAFLFYSSAGFADEKAMTAMNEKLIANVKAAWDAFKNKDEKAFSELGTEDAVDVETDAIAWSRAETIQRMSMFDITDVSLTDFKVIWIDKDAAIVTYKASVKGTMKGQPLPGGEVYASDVCVSKNGKWMYKFHQETPIASMAPAAQQ